MNKVMTANTIDKFSRNKAGEFKKLAVLVELTDGSLSIEINGNLVPRAKWQDTYNLWASSDCEIYDLMKRDMVISGIYSDIEEDFCL